MCVGKTENEETTAAGTWNKTETDGNFKILKI